MFIKSFDNYISKLASLVANGYITEEYSEIRKVLSVLATIWKTQTVS